jgi:hypothetical protein
VPRFVDHVTAAETKTFADQSVAGLRAAEKGGWTILSDLMEPDFQKLVGVVDAKAAMK